MVIITGRHEVLLASSVWRAGILKGPTLHMTVPPTKTLPTPVVSSAEVALELEVVLIGG